MAQEKIPPMEKRYQLKELVVCIMSQQNHSG